MTSVPALSLEPTFRRSHGSLYKVLDRGDLDTDALRRLLVANRPADWPTIFAVDASGWARCDDETSPERGFYYSASKHSAGQPIVVGWSYQWITQLDWAKDSWTAPLDATRITPGADATTATVAQVRRLRPGRAQSRVGRHPRPDRGPHPRRPRLLLRSRRTNGTPAARGPAPSSRDGRRTPGRA